MTELEEACSDLAAWLPVARALIAEPDVTTMAVITGTDVDSGSAPPWNQAVAALLFDIHAGLRDIEQELRQDVTRRPAHQCRRHGPWTEAAAARVIGTIPRLAEAASPDHVARAQALVDGYIIRVMQLPAVDMAEKPQPIHAPCPRPGCGRPMLRYLPIRRILVCLGCIMQAEVHIGAVTGDPILKWEDGLIT